MLLLICCLILEILLLYQSRNMIFFLIIIILFDAHNLLDLVWIPYILSHFCNYCSLCYYNDS